LLLLVQYLSIIDELKKNIGLQNPIKFSTPHLEVDGFSCHLKCSLYNFYIYEIYILKYIYINITGT